MAKYTKFEQMSRVGSRDPPRVTTGYHGTMIWLEQKLFWVFWFISFIMKIEMQNRVTFSKHICKKNFHHDFYCKIDVTPFDIE